MQHIFIRNRSSGKGCEAPAEDAATEERPDTTLRLEESEKVPTCILGSVLRLEMIMQKGQDEVLAKEAMEFCVLIHEQLGNVLATAPPIDVRNSQCRPAQLSLGQRMLAHSRRIEGGMQSRPATRQAQALHQGPVIGGCSRARQFCHQC